MIDAAVTRIAAACLDAPLHESPWDHVVQALAREIRDVAIVIALAPGWQPLGPAYWVRLDRELMARAARHDHVENPWGGISSLYREGHFGHGFDKFTPRELRAGPFFNEWMRPAGLSGEVVYGGFPVLRGSVDELLVTLLGPRGLDALDDASEEIAARSMPYLRRTFLLLEKLRGQLDAPATEPHWSRAVLDRLRMPAFVVDAAGRVAHQNPAADDALRACRMLQRIRGRLTSPRPDVARRLERLVGQAASNLAARGGAMRLDDDANVEIVITPLGATGGGHALVVVVGQRDVRGADELLRSGFGLTRAEARLAAQLADCMSLRDAAAAEGITYETARTYLKRATEKLGLRSQAAVIDRVRQLTVMRTD